MGSPTIGDLTASLLEAPEGLEEFNTWAQQRRWSDGLPLIPPTPERVERMLGGTDWPPDRVVGRIPPRFASATVSAIAANAVMAGCGATAMPVLITATEALCEPIVNAYGAQATTHPCGLMLLISGPAAFHAGVTGGAGLFGPGFVGNVTIGRAMRLILLNIGGAFPGDMDRATQGSPAKISFCFAENEQDCPWEPYRVSRGYGYRESIVAVTFGEAPHNLNDHTSVEPAGLAFMMAQSIATVGKNNTYVRNSDYFVVVGPEHAAVFARSGWDRSDLQEYLHERARIPYRVWRMGGLVGMTPQPKFMEAADDDLQVRITDRPDDIHVVVGGGPGLHSSWIPSHAGGRMMSKAIRAADGSPLLFQ